MYKRKALNGDCTVRAIHTCINIRPLNGDCTVRAIHTCINIRP